MAVAQTISYAGKFDDGAQAAVACGTNKGTGVLYFIDKEGTKYQVPINCGQNI